MSLNAQGAEAAAGQAATVTVPRLRGVDAVRDAANDAVAGEAAKVVAAACAPGVRNVLEMESPISASNLTKAQSSHYYTQGYSLACVPSTLLYAFLL